MQGWNDNEDFGVDIFHTQEREMKLKDSKLHKSMQNPEKMPGIFNKAPFKRSCPFPMASKWTNSHVVSRWTCNWIRSHLQRATFMFIIQPIQTYIAKSTNNQILCSTYFKTKHDTQSQHFVNSRAHGRKTLE